ncbi:hypothetical protein WJX73_005649 [Symbiochloris irregularis]|uniref:Uncharacterized protein n=1 Tax=Symbiochloris irregularis TaxID=706552 RepID=A0AAW1P6F5_9CHLO
MENEVISRRNKEVALQTHKLAQSISRKEVRQANKKDVERARDALGQEQAKEAERQFEEALKVLQHVNERCPEAAAIIRRMLTADAAGGQNSRPGVPSTWLIEGAWAVQHALTGPPISSAGGLVDSAAARGSCISSYQET